MIINSKNFARAIRNHIENLKKGKFRIKKVCLHCQKEIRSNKWVYMFNGYLHIKCGLKAINSKEDE